MLTSGNFCNKMSAECQDQTAIGKVSTQRNESEHTWMKEVFSLTTVTYLEKYPRNLLSMCLGHV